MARFVHPAAGSVAIVTGASSGLGREIARQLARRGHVVLAVARRAEALEELAAEARAAGGGGRIEPFAQDLAEADAAKKVFEAASRLGEIGWLVNNAGIVTFGRFEQADVEQQRAVVRLNCEAIVALTGYVLPTLVRSGRGIVLNVASSAGLQATPGWIVYGATKAFVISFTEGLYEELRGSGVSTTALAPGPITTEIFGTSPAAKSRKPPPWELPPADVAARALNAALAGKSLFVPGLAVRILAFGARFSPRALSTWASARIGLRFIGMPPMPPRS